MVSAVALAAIVALAAAGCGGGDDTPSAPPAPPPEPTTTLAVDPADPDGPADPTEPGETTTTQAPASAGPEDLQAALLAPEAVAPGLGLDPTVGTGAFEPDLCEEVTIEQVWDDQASQALSVGRGAEGLILTQAVLRTADAATATTFVDDLVAALGECQATEITEVDEAATAGGGPADAALVVELGDPDDSFTDVAGLVRVGALVTVFRASDASGGESPLTADVLIAAGQALRG